MSDKITNENKIALVNLPEMPESVDNALTNLSDGLSKRVGDTFSDLWYLIFGGISHQAEKRKLKYSADLIKYKEELKASTSKIPSENKIEPDIQITAQALENSKYCISSEELRKLYVNLISSSMDNRQIPYTHPSFAEIIKQMSPLEAKLLPLLPINKFILMADYIIQDKTSKAFNVILENVILPNHLSNNIEQLSSAMSSLIRLGLVSYDKDSSATEPGKYDLFKKTDYYQKLCNDIIALDTKREISTRNYIASITPLGKDFIHCCVNP